MYKKLINKVNDSPNLTYRKRVKFSMVLGGLVGAALGVGIAIFALWLYMNPILTPNATPLLPVAATIAMCIFVFAVGAFVFSACVGLIIFARKIKYRIG